MTSLTGAAFRSRKPVSLPGSDEHHQAHEPLLATQRFPHQKEDQLSADERIQHARIGLGLGLAPEATHTHHNAAIRTAKGQYFPSGGVKMAPGEWKLLVVIVLIACVVRLWRINWPDSVVFDEVHFGKFASKYLKTQYYVDVHPPLAKLLITLAALIGGYDAQFDFKDIGKPYENVPYVIMRLLPATLGIGLVPIAYLTMKALDLRTTSAVLGSLFITFENGLVTQSRLILLDSPLVFFTGLTIFFWVGFTNENKHKPFTENWWVWLTLSGLSLGAVVSCKWVGLFTIATVGCSTIRQLWILLGDLKVTPRIWTKHFLARALCLIIIPMLFYMAMFEIHFLILENSGDGDGFMSSEFQHTLGGRHMSDTYADVSIGSTITLRHVHTQGGYLHSHPHNYPGGSKQQQITLYPHRDGNNEWRILNVTADGDSEFDWANHSPPVPISDLMQIRLEHISTSKKLHSHDVRPPVSEVEFQNEVSGYGFPGFMGDANDYWVVELYEGDDEDPPSLKRIRTLRSKFRLKHYLSGCYLYSHKVKLPEWGYEQQEVTCNKNAPKDNSLWYVETNTHPQLPEDAPKVNYQTPGFLSKFLELQQVMWTTNAGLTERHTFDSRPQDWPRLRRGINFWVKNNRQIYLIGNPWVWYLSTLSLAAYAIVRGFLILREKRGYQDFNQSHVVKYDELCGFLFMAWALHYFPFYLMARQLFLHHYFPALYFAILLTCVVFDMVTANFRSRVRLQILAVLLIIAIWNFNHFSPLSYGTPWTRSACTSSKWFKTWDFSCNEFLESYAAYDYLGGPPTASKPALVTVGGGGQGRDPVVVHAPVNHELPKIDTSILANAPEPGPDIFNVAPPKEVKSESIDHLQVQKQKQPQTTERKVEKVVVPAPNLNQGPPPVGKMVGGTGDKGEEGGKSSSSSMDNSKQDPVVAVPKGNDKAAGPKDQGEAERDRVVEKLFGQ